MTSSVHHLIILMLQKRMSKDKAFTGSKTIKQNTKMKKRILGAALLVAIAVAAGWNYQQNKQDVQLSDLALENVEALAQPEKATDDCDNFSNMSCSSRGVVRDQMYPASRL